MVCKNCNAEINDSYSFCINCGTHVEKPEVAPAMSGEPPVYQQTPPAAQYGQPMYYGAQNNITPQQETEPVIKISTYLLWFFICSIPVAGLIFCIIYAIDSKSKNKSNYFRAQLIWMVITAVISMIVSAVITAVFSAAAVSMPEIVNEFSYML